MRKPVIKARATKATGIRVERKEEREGSDSS